MKIAPLTIIAATLAALLSPPAQAQTPVPGKRPNIVIILVDLIIIIH